MFARAFIAAALLAGCTGAMPDSRDPLTSSDTHSSDIVRFSAECGKWDDWNKPARPFQIYANTWYVGTCGIAAILVTGEDGHVLIDTGTREGAEVIAANIRALGIELTDITHLLYSHEHFDHMGGHAHMQRLTGAKVLTVAEAAGQFATGETSKDDPQFGMHDNTEPVASDAVTLLSKADGDPQAFTFANGDISLTIYRTPGHAPGGITSQWESCGPNGFCKTIVYADSLSPVSRDDYRFSDHPEYLAQYHAGLERIETLDCDILLTPHPSHSRMIERAATGTFEGSVTCAGYAAGKRRDIAARLEREAGANQ